MPPADRSPTIGPSETLDPSNWDEVRAQAHRMLDEAIDAIANIREQPVWRPIPDEVRARFRAEIPREPSDLGDIYREYSHFIAPYATGNVHPGFMGWVHGGGTVVGMLAEMLAAGLNANLGGRDHMPIEVERQITEWTRTHVRLSGRRERRLRDGNVDGELDGGVGGANGGAWTFRARERRRRRRRVADGLHVEGRAWLRFQGDGSCGLRHRRAAKLAVDRSHRVDVGAMRAQIKRDREIGLQPFLVVGSAGTVDIGAIDDLAALSALCREEKLWFHVDGAYGALGVLSPALAPRLAGLENADSVALDFHKWGQVPYDAGFLLVRDSQRHLDAFAAPAAYLRRETRGLAAGSPWPCDLGPDLSRGFRALKTWFTLKAFGTEKLGAMIERTCQLAHYLEMKVLSEPRLELMAPAQLNIVCFRYRAEDADRVNSEIVADIHESGIAAPSTTTLDGKLAIRAAIVNHRTDTSDLDALVAAVLEFGARRSSDNCAA